MGKLAERLGGNPRTIRYYESIDLLPRPSAPARATGPTASPTSSAWASSARRSAWGLALDEVREILALRQRGEAPCGYVRQLISQELADIDRRLEELGALHQELVEREPRAQASPATQGSICGLIEHVRQKSGHDAPGLR